MANIGDRIEMIHEYGAEKGEKGTIRKKGTGNGWYGIEFDSYSRQFHSLDGLLLEGPRGYFRGYYVEEKNFIIIPIPSKNSFMSSLKEIVSNLFTNEPQKSRQLAGIVDREGNLTEEGKDVYLNYLLSLEKPEGFDTKIVAPVIAEIEKSKK